MIKVNIYGWRLYLRVGLVLIFCIAFGRVFWNPNWLFTQIFLGCSILLLTLELILFLHRTNRDIERMLGGLKHEEYSVNFSQNKIGKKYSKLHSTLDDIIQEQGKRSDLEKAKFKHFQNAIDHLEVGLVVLNESNEILISNSYFNLLFGFGEQTDSRGIIKENPEFIAKINDASDEANFIISKNDLGQAMASDITCKVNKYKTKAGKHTLILLSNSNTKNSSETFETWVNFSKVISHEILNGIAPLTSLTSTLFDQVERLEGNEKIKTSMKKALDIIQERTATLQHYSERYRTMQKLPEPNKIVLNWNDVITRNIQNLNSDISKNEIEVKVFGSELNSSFSADSWQMDQVFSNMLLNGIHAMEENDEKVKEIEIEVNANRLNYLVRISDNGIGIDPNNRSNIFMPFFTTRDEGSGIGLSVVKQILWKHNAEIYLDPESKKTSFVIRFPKVN